MFVESKTILTLASLAPMTISFFDILDSVKRAYINGINMIK